MSGGAIPGICCASAARVSSSVAVPPVTMIDWTCLISTTLSVCASPPLPVPTAFMRFAISDAGVAPARALCPSDIPVTTENDLGGEGGGGEGGGGEGGGGEGGGGDGGGGDGGGGEGARRGTYTNTGNGDIETTLGRFMRRLCGLSDARVRVKPANSVASRSDASC